MSSRVKEISEKAMPILRDTGVKSASLFGSFARGEERKDSDIDLLVEFEEPKSLFEVVEIEERLTIGLGRQVDILSQLPQNPYIKPRI